MTKTINWIIKFYMQYIQYAIYVYLKLNLSNMKKKKQFIKLATKKIMFYIKKTQVYIFFEYQKPIWIYGKCAFTLTCAHSYEIKIKII